MLYLTNLISHQQFCDLGGLCNPQCRTSEVRIEGPSFYSYSGNLRDASWMGWRNKSPSKDQNNQEDSFLIGAYLDPNHWETLDAMAESYAVKASDLKTMLEKGKH